MPKKTDNLMDDKFDNMSEIDYIRHLQEELKKANRKKRIMSDIEKRKHWLLKYMCCDIAENKILYPLESNPKPLPMQKNKICITKSNFLIPIGSFEPTAIIYYAESTGTTAGIYYGTTDNKGFISEIHSIRLPKRNNANCFNPSASTTLLDYGAVFSIYDSLIDGFKDQGYEKIIAGFEYIDTLRPSHNASVLPYLQKDFNKLKSVLLFADLQRRALFSLAVNSSIIGEYLLDKHDIEVKLIPQKVVSETMCLTNKNFLTVANETFWNETGKNLLAGMDYTAEDLGKKYNVEKKKKVFSEQGIYLSKSGTPNLKNLKVWISYLSGGKIKIESRKYQTNVRTSKSLIKLFASFCFLHRYSQGRCKLAHPLQMIKYDRMVHAIQKKQDKQFERFMELALKPKILGKTNYQKTVYEYVLNMLDSGNVSEPFRWLEEYGANISFEDVDLSQKEEEEEKETDLDKILDSLLEDIDD